MKAYLVTLLALSSLALSPAVAAPKKMSSPEKGKSASAASASAAKPKLSAAQAGARELVGDLTTTQKSKMLTLLNDGTPVQLAAIKGISKTRAAAIGKARPFKSIDEVILVSGIGVTTFSEIVTHARSLTTSRKKASTRTSPVKTKTKAKPKSKSSKS